MTTQQQDPIADIMTALAATAAEIAAVPDMAQQILDASGASLGALYNAAEAQQDTTALQHISDAWQQAQALAQAVQTMDSGVRAALEAAQTVEERRQILAAELGTLVNALTDGDLDHPLVSDLYEQAYTETAEYFAESDYDHAVNTVQDKTGFDWNRCSDIVSALTDCDSADTIADLTVLIDALTDLRDGLLEDGADG